MSVIPFALAGNLTRNNLKFLISFGEERIVSNLNGITIIGDKQHVDHYTLVQHTTPNCESLRITREYFQTIQQAF